MRSRALVLSAAALTLAGEVEVLLGSADAGERAVSALAVPAVTLPVAWCRRAPLAALAAISLALLVQAALGGILVGRTATAVVALAIALAAAGRFAAGVAELAGAAACALVAAATRIAFDPAGQAPREALLTLGAVAVPLLLGRWARGQTLLQRELAERAERRARDRGRNARQAAEEERERIALDLQAAVADDLRRIVRDAEALHHRLRAGDRADAAERLSTIATTARAALADVRRVLGVLRHDGEAAPLTPPRTGADGVRPELAPPSPEPPPSPAALAVAAAPRAASGVADALLASAVLVGGAVELALLAPDDARALASLTAVGLAAPLLWRRRRPVLAALGVLGAVALQSLLVDLGTFPLADVAAIVCATYAIGAWAQRGAASVGIALVAAGATAHAAVFYPDGVLAALLGGVALPWAVGRVVHGNRRLTREERRRHEEVEERRRRDARAAVTAERMRVARELHDAVAHGVSVIAIQAAGAEGLVARDPARAEGHVALVVALAREALAELGRLTTLPDPAGDGAPPGLARLDELARRAGAAGLPVTLQVDGPPVPLPAGVDLAAFRIVQEALANTAKHAGAHAARVTVRYDRRAVELEVRDDGRGASAARAARAGGGHGLVGMRERVALYGGSLQAGPQPDGGFLVRARLPLDPS